MNTSLSPFRSLILAAFAVILIVSPLALSPVNGADDDETPIAIPFRPESFLQSH